MTYRLLCLIVRFAFALIARADGSYHEHTRVALAACGKDMPACPASGVINSAIAWEIFRQTKAARESAGAGK